MKIIRNKGCHKGDTFRELCDMWQEADYCQIDEDGPDNFTWVNEPGDILLYEYARYDTFPGLPNSWNYALFGNMQLTQPKCFPWIFWSRHPKKLEAKINEGLKAYGERSIESVFLGKVENGIQLQNRTQYDWSQCIELFSMPITIGDTVTWPYTQEQYLEHISNSKFGLVMPGYGPKCNREIEYLGLGVVPLVIDGVDTTYYNPLIENLHFLRARNPDHANKIIKNISEDQWEFLSYNGRMWYEKNCSRKGSFETTMTALEGKV